MDELKPCPFCGSSATLENQFGKIWWVQCEQDHATNIEHSSPRAAEIEWNTRAPLQNGGTYGDAVARDAEEKARLRSRRTPERPE